jgi:CBS domain-containing membrane protein
MLAPQRELIPEKAASYPHHLRLARPPEHPQEGVTLARVEASSLSMALTGTVLLLLQSSHPPAGATVLIVSLGLLQTPLEMLMLMSGVLLLTVVGWTINRLFGIPVPVWKPKE